MLKRILFIHQSAELYGSDKTLLDLIIGIDKSKYEPYVILPHSGLLSDELNKFNIPIFYMPVMKISRGIKFYNLLALFQNLFSLFKVYRLDKKFNFDIVYTNTLATFLGGIYSFTMNKKHIWHIHEIVRKPRMINILFAYITEKTAEKLIFNSNASYLHLNNENKKIALKSTVILNGVELNQNISIKSKDDIINIGLVGRIHSWKGQELLLHAFYNLQKIHLNIHLYFIGSTVVGMEYHKTNLEEIISNYKVLDKVFFIPFTKNISEEYKKLDIVIVPSTEPEPFGMVTIEAMNHKRPVIVSKHGGSIDIVVDNINGLFFEPNNQKDLELKLTYLIVNETERTRLALEGYETVKNKFSVKQYIAKIEELYEN